MRVLLIAAGLIFSVAPPGLGDQPGAAPAMPMLSPANTIEACFATHPDTAERKASCIGEYTAACAALRSTPDIYPRLTACVGEESLAWEARLRVLLATDPAALDAWAAGRDSACALAAPNHSGDAIQGLTHARCRLDHAARRTIELLAQPLPGE